MDIDAQRAQRLFQAVVAQSLVDATADDAPFSKKPLKRRKSEDDEAYLQRTAASFVRRQASANRPRTDAREWLLNDMTGFAQVVSLAGYNPTDIRERARKLAREGWPRRAEIAAFEEAA